MKKRSERNPTVVEGASGDAVLHHERCIDGGFRILSSGLESIEVPRCITEDADVHRQRVRDIASAMPEPLNPIGRMTYHLDT